MEIKRVLLAIAPNQDVGTDFKLVLALANHHPLEITLLAVIDDLPGDVNLNNAPVSHQQLLEMAFKVNESRLNEIAEQLKSQYPNITFEQSVMAGPAFLKIIEQANHQRVDMIVINANRDHKRTASQFGSTTRQLMRQSNIPVWTLPRDDRASINAIVAAVDVSENSNEGMALNKRIIDAALPIARQTGAKLYLVHAWSHYGEGYLRYWARQSNLNIAMLAQAERDKRLHACQELLAEMQISDVKVSIELLEGAAEKVIPEFVSSNTIDLLVMGTLCRSGIPGMIIGNTAESMLDAIGCSVLTLKPDGFVSPVFS